MSDGAEGVVTAVFAQSFHIVLDGAIVCLGDHRLGRGPLNALIPTTPPGGWAYLGFAVGQSCRVDQSLLFVGESARFDFRDATPWSAETWPRAWSAETLTSSLAALGATATGKVPIDGLACLAFGEGCGVGLGGAMQETAGLRAASISDWLATELAGNDDRHDPSLVRRAHEAVKGLMGLGPGLTPAGDDVLAGLLIALHAANEGAAASALANFIHATPTDQTTALSRAFLDAAIEGLPGEAMAVMITALLSGDHASLPVALGNIDAIGHTSGWDMLAGAVLGLAAVATARAGAGPT